MSPARVERRHLEALAVLGEHAGFAHAANALFVTPSTFAATIRQMERLVGARLVERTSSGMQLNQRGREAAIAAAAALRSMDGVVSDARSADAATSGSLFVQTTPTLAEGLGATLVAALLERRPGLRMSVRAPRRPVVADVAHAVAAAEVDFGMTERMTRLPSGVVQVPLGAVEVAYAFPSTATIKPRSVVLSHLATFGLIAVPYFESSDVYTELRSRSSAITDFIRARVTDRQAFADLALAGVAGFLCEYVNRHELNAMGLHVARFKQPFTRSFATIIRADDRRPVIADVVATSQQVAHSNRPR